MTIINGLTIGIITILIGIYGILTKRNLIKMVMCLYIMNSSVILFFISLGYRSGAQAAIVENGDQLMVDPLPQALMLTSIVIGLVITSLGLALAIKIYKEHSTINTKRLIEK
ncbi:MAG: cation:proton antiporter subunit C [Candidatus Margulisbacteria bacterium]|nr:cation:proton antiporter subunit C [Candidatus Margulisiibacteriota bacterium]MBU1021849.1 cation:proton antiporter subunit C [Candidatus Margulisiibacteriota bacterium]MBU1729008.1 cation:proton antiporter subunit C [Candidatus Margulisiibacteriota bacterium]MBU1954439.1 cation:proton antiporter subunit C [Candidatus Margulisiibacteriota bacterium]